MFVAVALVSVTGLFWQAREHRFSDPLDQAARGAITAGSPESFLRAARLRAALDGIAAKAPRDAGILNLTLEPTEVSATLLRADGSEMVAFVDAALTTTVRPATNALDGNSLKIASIPAGAPERFLRVASSKLALHSQNLERLSLYAIQSPGQQPYWHAQYTHPPLKNEAMAALDGTDVRYMGEPSAAQRAETRAAERRSAAAAKTAQQASVAAAKQAGIDAQRRLQELTR